MASTIVAQYRCDSSKHEKQFMTFADPMTCNGTLAVLLQNANAPRPGRGIMFCAAGLATREIVACMAKEARGICTVTLNEATAMRLGIAVQGRGSAATSEQAYYGNSVESVECSETGISASERATTMRTLGRPAVSADDIVSPGHIMVQIARNVLRDGASLPEIANALLAANRIARFSGWIDILDEEGELATADICRALAHRLGIPCFEAAAAHASARDRLPAWTAAVDFSLSLDR